MPDYIVMITGWIAFAGLAVWLASSKRITTTQLIDFMDMLWDNPHVKAHFESGFKKYYKQFEGTEFGKALKVWWNSEDDEEEEEEKPKRKDKKPKGPKDVKIEVVPAKNIVLEKVEEKEPDPEPEEKPEPEKKELTDEERKAKARKIIEEKRAELRARSEAEKPKEE